ncbi:unnamed protein product, partial [Phaeothamnion confervicola]
CTKRNQKRFKTAPDNPASVSDESATHPSVHVKSYRGQFSNSEELMFFSDAMRFQQQFVVGETVRHVKAETGPWVGPGSYAQPSTLGSHSRSPSRSSRAPMDAPTSPKSHEHSRGSHLTGTLRGEVYIAGAAAQQQTPGPGAHTGQIMPGWDEMRGGPTLRRTLSSSGMTVSSCMGSSSRLVSPAKMVLRDGVLFLKGQDEPERTFVGPGAYLGTTHSLHNSLIRPSHNVRAAAAAEGGERGRAAERLRRSRSFSASPTA